MREVVVRVARTEQEVMAAGALAAEAYHADGLIDDADEYRAELLDAARRAREATLLVAVVRSGTGAPSGDEPGLAGDVVVGTVTLAPAGASYAEVAEAGELEMRMLAVAPEARRRGVAEALVRACLREAVRSGYRTVVLSTLDSMSAAHRLYERLGFVRVPDRDWGHEEIKLRVCTWHAPSAPGAAVESRTWRPVSVHAVDGWTVGVSAGFTRRANSTLTLGQVGDVDAGIDRVERHYTQAGLTATFRVDPGSAPSDLGARLGSRGYTAVAGTLVLVRTDLRGVGGAGAQPHGLRVAVADAPDDRWLDVWLPHKAHGSGHPAGGADPALARSILAASPALYLTAVLPGGDRRDRAGDEGGGAAGVVRVAFADDWAALACLVVPAAHRRRGIARALTLAALQAAAAHGAERAFLQVELSNAPAIALYEGLGFGPAATYEYYDHPSRPDRRSRTVVGSGVAAAVLD